MPYDDISGMLQKAAKLIERYTRAQAKIGFRVETWFGQFVHKASHIMIPVCFPMTWNDRLTMVNQRNNQSHALHAQLNVNLI